MNSHLDALKDQTLFYLDNPIISAHNPYAGNGQGSHQSTSTTDHYLLPFPTSISGTMCSTDASTMLDNTTSTPRPAGLEIFIINTDVHPQMSIFIKATM